MRIVSLSPGITETLQYLGVEVAGRSVFCPSRAPVVGTALYADKRLLKKLNPCFIFTSTIIQKRLSEELEKEFNVVHFDVRTLEDVFSMIRRLGAMCEREESAERLVAKMEREISFSPKKRARLVVEEWHEPFGIAGNWVPEIAERCGYIYPLKRGELSRKAKEGEVAEFNPHLLIRSICGMKLPPFLPFPLRCRVVSVADRVFNSPGPSLITGAQILKFYHPFPPFPF